MVSSRVIWIWRWYKGSLQLRPRHMDVMGRQKHAKTENYAVLNSAEVRLILRLVLRMFVCHVPHLSVQSQSERGGKTTAKSGPGLTS